MVLACRIFTDLFISLTFYYALWIFTSFTHMFHTSSICLKSLFSEPTVNLKWAHSSVLINYQEQCVCVYKSVFVCVSEFVHFPRVILVCQAGGQTASSNILLFVIDSMSANCHRMCVCVYVSVSGCVHLDLNVLIRIKTLKSFGNRHFISPNFEDWSHLNVLYVCLFFCEVWCE